MGYYEAEYIVARYFGMSEKKFMKSCISYVQRLCNRHYDEVAAERIIRWNMMQGHPPEPREEPIRDVPDADISKESIREAGRIAGNIGRLLSDGGLKKIKSE